MFPRSDAATYVPTDMFHLPLWISLIALAFIGFAAYGTFKIKEFKAYEFAGIVVCVGLLGAVALQTINNIESKNALAQNIKTAYTIEDVKFNGTYESDKTIKATITKDGEKKQVVVYQDKKTYEPTLFLAVD